MSKHKQIGDRCWYCGGKLIWDNDFSAEDVGYDDAEGIVTFLHCSEYGAEVEYKQLDQDDTYIEPIEKAECMKCCKYCTHYCIDDSDGEHFKDACLVYTGQVYKTVQDRGHCDMFEFDDHFEERMEQRRMK